LNRLREALKAYHIHPRKGLGQSFLNDERIIQRIAAAAAPEPDDVIVEIGAGIGLLTEELAKSAGRVIALEIDPRLLLALRDRFSGHPGVEIWPGDVLDYDFSALGFRGRLKVVGNIPYHISTPILFHLLEHRRAIHSLVLMFQKELAQRIAAPPGGRNYGIPSVLCARYTEVTTLLTVPPDCFYPVPKVFSSVLRFRIRRELDLIEGDDSFPSLVRAAFAQRRKTLRNNLRAFGLPEEALDALFTACGIDGMRRAETLSVAEFERLASGLREPVLLRFFLTKGQKK